MDRIYSSKNIIVRNLSVIIAFLLPIIILIIVYASKDIYPFGDRMYLRSDMYHQYATFLKEFQSILKNGDSLLYSWNIGLGSDIPATYAYYLATPVYWLTVFLPSDHIPEIMSSFIILKSGLMSATFVYYLQYRTGRRNLAAAAFGVFYALSSYMAAYSWNLMWLDCLVLLPLIIAGLEKLVKERKFLLYTIALAVSILSNYYISIMICIFLVLYFIYLLICEYKFEGIKRLAGCVFRFALYSVLAALMAAVTVLPAVINLFSTASGEFSFPSTFKFYFNMFEMISHAVMNVEPTVLKGYIPNIYCTVALFMLIPLFLLCRKLSVRVIVGKIVLALIFLFSFSINILTYIWHGFHFPNSLSSRQSFIYIFLILVMGYEALLEAEKFKYRELIGCFIAGAVFIYGLQILFASEEYTVTLVSISAAFLALYFIWMLLKKSGKIPCFILGIIILVLAAGEAAVNTISTGYTTTSRTAYMEDNEAYLSLLSSIEDEDFYRVEKLERRTKNDGAWLNYKSASEFSSTTLSALSDFYDAFGMQSSTNSFSYYGHTPLVSAILDVRYHLSEERVNDSLVTFEGEQDGYYLYKNKYSLSLAFMVGDTTQDVSTGYNNPFDVQNEFACAASGVSDLFSIYPKSSGEYITYLAKEDGRGYIFINEKLESAKVVVTRDGKQVFEETFTGLENPQIIDIGDLEEGDLIAVNSEDEEVSSISLYPAVMNYDLFDEVISSLEEGMLEIDSYDDTHIRGTIEARTGGLMFTSIPYCEGWELYVDGVKTEYSSFKGAFITATLSEGVHTIEFVYHSPGFAAASAVSAVSVLLFALSSIVIYRRRKYRRALSPDFPDRSDDMPDEET